MSEKTLDCSDLDNVIGKPMEPARMREPVQVNDIRRWVQAMHYPNRNHYDADYASEGRFGQIVAPQSFGICMDDGHGAIPAGAGRIPNTHFLFGGDEWWFYGPQIRPGDKFNNERVPFDYVVKQTKFAGPTCFQRGDNNYYNQDGDPVAKQRSTSIRYNPDWAREASAINETEDPQWTEEQLADLEEQKFTYIKSLHDLGHGKRLWSTVAVGDQLPTRVIGPHSIASMATEWRAYPFTIWGAVHRIAALDFEELGFLPEMAGHEGDPELESKNPEQTDGAYVGPSRGHLFPHYARLIGMPRGYGYGASMGAWIVDYLAGWAGEWGRVMHSTSFYRGPALTGDFTIMNAEIIDKAIDENGQHFVQVDYKMKNQNDVTMATATAEIALPNE